MLRERLKQDGLVAQPQLAWVGLVQRREHPDRLAYRAEYVRVREELAAIETVAR